MSCPLLAQAQVAEVANASGMPTVLSAGVQSTLVLPQGMYGQWQVQATLLEATTTQGFPSVINDIWVLEKLGATVRLRNPVTRAEATIFVEEVEGNSASFYHISKARGIEVKEQPRITLVDDTLLGYTVIHRKLLNRQGGVRQNAGARYKLRAERIGQPPVQVTDAGNKNVGLEQGLTGYETYGPQIDIAPIQNAPTQGTP